MLKKKDTFNHELKDRLVDGGVEWLDAEATLAVELARDNHKRLPWAEIGAAVRELTKDLDDVQLAKAYCRSIA